MSEILGTLSSDPLPHCPVIDGVCPYFESVIHPRAIPNRSYDTLLHTLLVASTILGFLLAYAYFREATSNARRIVANDAQWDRTLMAVKVGKWTWDTNLDKISWDAPMFDIFEEDPAKFIPNYDNFINLLDEADVGWISDLVNKTVDDGEKGYLRAVFKLKTGQYVRTYGKVINFNGSKIFAGICTPSSAAEYTGRPVISSTLPPKPLPQS